MQSRFRPKDGVLVSWESNDFPNVTQLLFDRGLLGLKSPAMQPRGLSIAASGHSHSGHSSTSNSVPREFDHWAGSCLSFSKAFDYTALFGCPENHQGEIWNFQRVTLLLASLVFPSGTSLLAKDILLSLLIILFPWNCFICPNNKVILCHFLFLKVLSSCYWADSYAFFWF